MYMPIIPALRRLRQENHEFEARLGYIVKFEACLTASPCVKKIFFLKDIGCLKILKIVLA
jgi:hypothetical protein